MTITLQEINCSECGQSIGWSEEKTTHSILCYRCINNLSMVQEIMNAKVIVFSDNEKDMYKPRPPQFHPAKSKSIKWSIKITTEFLNWLSNGRKIT